jgi:uncharacterized protein (TIGR03086 family)
MNSNNSPANASPANTGPATTSPANPPDFFGDFAAVAAAVADLVATTENALDPATAASIVPACPEFTVADLLDHLVLVTGRIVVIGEGRHWTEIMEPDVSALTNGTGRWSELFAADVARIPDLWFKPELLGELFVVPWGEIPGAAFLATYTGELAVHGWDLAHATGQHFTVPDRHLGPAYEAGSFITPEMRQHPDTPFEAAVGVDPSASLLDRLAGLMGRPVST